MLEFSKVITSEICSLLIVLRSLLTNPLCHFNGEANKFFFTAFTVVSALYSRYRRKVEIEKKLLSALWLPMFDFIRLAIESVL